jgi:hypothetical protein
MMKESVAHALEGGRCRAKARRYNTGRHGGPPQNGFFIILLEEEIREQRRTLAAVFSGRSESVVRAKVRRRDYDVAAHTLPC